MRADAALAGTVQMRRQLATFVDREELPGSLQLASSVNGRTSDHLGDSSMNEIVAVEHLRRRQCTWSCIGALILGLLFGFIAGRSFAPVQVTSQVVLPNGPIDLKVNVTGISSAPVVTQPVPPLSGADSQFLETLSARTREAIASAKSKTSDPSQVPRVAAEEFVRGLGNAAQIPKTAVEEFVKGLSSEAGKSVVGLFSELIKAGFGLADDKTKDREAFSAVFAQHLVVYAGSPVAACPEPRIAAHKLGGEQVFFETNHFLLPQSADIVVHRIAELARTNSDAVILVSANTDTTGSTQANRVLAQKRSASVRSQLVQAGGIAPNRIFWNELSSGSLPIVTGTPRAEPRNRAVTIEVRQ